MIQITIITLICCLLFGVPIAFAIGIAGTAGLYFGSTAPMFMVVKQFFEGINSFSYMAIPLFILAGAIMGKGGISKRIVNFASAILSWLRGGTAITTVGASMIFAAVSGSGAATISAIGGITVPEMLKKGYSRGFTAAMSAGAGSLGPIVPPSVDMIVFGCITGFSISRLFVGGIIPGFIIGLSLMIYCYIYAKKRNIDYGGKFRGKVVWAAFKDSIWALLMPIIIIGGVMGGAFTATEAGAVACVYGLIVSVFVYKSMSFKDLINVLRSASVNMAIVRLFDEAETVSIIKKVIGFEKRGSFMNLTVEGHAKIVAAEEELILDICKKYDAEYLGTEYGEKWFENRITFFYPGYIMNNPQMFGTLDTVATYDNIEKIYWAMKKAVEETYDGVRFISHSSHWYDWGCMNYSRFIIDNPPEDQEECIRLHNRIWNAGVRAAIANGGVINDHHGVGLKLGRLMKESYGPAMQVLQGIKKELDPNGIMNPYKMGL